MAYDQRRKELDQQIAELRAKIAAGAGDVGTASYILRGDTALMDRAARAEQSAIDKMYGADQAAIERAMREAESEKQRAFQAAENQASRENTLKIAQMNKDDAESRRIDEYQEGYNNASDLLTIAMENLKKDPNNSTAQEAVVKWKNKKKYYAKKLGRDVEDENGEKTFSQFGQPTAQVPAQKPAASYSNSDIVKNLQAIDKGKWNNENRNKANTLIDSISDPALKQEWTEKFNQKGKTIEEINSGKAKAIEDAIATQDRGKLPKDYSVRSFDGVPYVAKKVDGNWVKVKKWGN